MAISSSLTSNHLTNQLHNSNHFQLRIPIFWHFMIMIRLLNKVRKVKVDLNQILVVIRLYSKGMKIMISLQLLDRTWMLICIAISHQLMQTESQSQKIKMNLRISISPWVESLRWLGSRIQSRQRWNTNTLFINHLCNKINKDLKMSNLHSSTKMLRARVQPLLKYHKI